MSMTLKTYLKWSILLTLGGVLFSGYLSGVRLISGICALNEPCPYFLGYPACYFGFAMYVIMFITSIAVFLKKVRSLQAVKIIFAISLLGILFAGYFVAQELLRSFTRGTFVLYGLGLPTCAYGLVFFIIIFSISLSTLLSQKKK